MLKAELAGEPLPEFAASKIEVELGEGTYVVRLDGVIGDRGTYALAGEHTPRKMTLIGVEGPNSGRTIPCIYQLVGNRLRVCYGFGGTLPLEFSTTKDSPYYLATYQRKTP
jgi:uncharacterized protein (TIGR03067 family)